MPNNKLQECAYPPCKNRFKPLAVGTSREKKYCGDYCKHKDRVRKTKEARDANAEYLTCALDGCEQQFKKRGNKKYCCRPHERQANSPSHQAVDEDPVEAAKRELQEKAEREETRQLIKEAAEVGLVIDKLVEAVGRAPKARFKQLIIPKTRAKRPPEDAMLLLSDLQIGEYISIEESGGLAEYSYPIFCERLKRLGNAVYSIVEIQSKSYSVPTLHVGMLGDMLSGEMVFIGQRNYIDLDLGDQFIEGADRVCELLVNLASVFETVEVECVPGNHGRLGQKKGEYKPHVNMDWFWYKYLEARLQNYKNIRWHIPKAWFVVKPVRSWCFLLQHGEDVRGWAGYPYYGLDRDAKNMRDMLQTIGKDFYYACYGHWHENEKKELVRGERLVNGSFVGGSIFSTKKLRKTGRPSQKFFGVSESKGITWHYDLYLDVD